MMGITELAPAKLNLTLDVGSPPPGRVPRHHLHHAERRPV